MLMIFSVTIYVIKMSDDDAVDIAVAVANALRIFLGKLQKPRKSDEIIVATAVLVDLY